MLKELQLTNFKSFAGESDPIPFAPVTILVGANASGKSNVFDAIRFLQGIGMGLSIAEILTGKWEGGREIYPALRGGPEGVSRGGEREFAIRTNVEQNVEAPQIPASKGYKKIRRVFQYEISCQAIPEPVWQDESLRASGDRQFEIRPESLAHAFQRTHSLLTQFVNAAEMNPGQRYRVAMLLNEYGDARFLSLDPSEMKQYVHRATPQLGSRGENLSAVVWHICQDSEQKSQFVHWVAALCAPEVRDIQFDQTATGKVLFQLVEGHSGGKKISAESVSDGTLRFMAVLAAMFTAPEGSLFLLEEIENGLHPTRVHLLVELLEQFAESRNLQIIGTTHSPQVLLSLSEQALRSAVLFARPEDTAGTVTRRLGDLPHFEEVTQKTQIDRLFTTGWLEQAL